MAKKPIPSWAKAIVAVQAVLSAALTSILMVEAWAPGTAGYKIVLVLQGTLAAVIPALAVVVGRPVGIVPQGDSGEIEAPRIVPKVSRGARP